jgi:hypothetical protein
MTGMTLSSTTLLPTTRTPTGPVLPPQTSISLASSLMVTMTVAPGVDTTGIDIEGAKAAYYSLVELSDRAVGDPARDWYQDFKNIAVDPALTGLLSDLTALSKSKVHIIGHSSYVAVATHVETKSVSLSVCIDNRAQDVVDAGGTSMKAGLGGRHPQSVVLIQNPDGRWRAANIEGHPEKSC